MGGEIMSTNKKSAIFFVHGGPGLSSSYFQGWFEQLEQVVKVTVERKVIVQFKKLLSADEKIEYDRKRKSM